MIGRESVMSHPARLAYRVLLPGVLNCREMVVSSGVDKTEANELSMVQRAILKQRLFFVAVNVKEESLIQKLLLPLILRLSQILICWQVMAVSIVKSREAVDVGLPVTVLSVGPSQLKLTGTAVSGVDVKNAESLLWQ